MAGVSASALLKGALGWKAPQSGVGVSCCEDRILRKLLLEERILELVHRPQYMKFHS